MRVSTAVITHPIRRLYYGWTMLTALALAQVTSWGILYYGFSVFLAPIRAETGWSLAAMTGAYSLALLLAGLAAVPVGRWLDRHGPRLLMTAGSCLAALLVVAWSLADSLLTFYLVWAGIGIVMAAVFYEPAFFVVANWFERRRGRALTLLTFVGGFASVIYIPLANRLIDAYGWRDALLVLAVILAVGTIPIHALLLRRHPGDLGLQPDGAPRPATDTTAEASPASRTLSDALHDRVFWWLSAAFMLAMLANVATTVHLIAYLIGRDFDAGFAAAAAGLVGLFALPGRLIFTPLGSRVQRRYVTALIFSMQALALVVLLLASGRLGVLIAVALFGAGFGAITPARAALVAEIYGAAHYGSISGVLALCITIARAAAPVGAGALYAVAGGYTPVLWSLVVVSILATLATLQVKDA
jgi:MFS family permease